MKNKPTHCLSYEMGLRPWPPVPYQPVPAAIGYLSHEYFEKLQKAFLGWPQFKANFQGIEKALTRDNGGVRTRNLGWVNLTGLQLTVDEVEAHLKRPRT
ncbi:MAG: hypothetical protein WBA28_02790, partial [Microbacteriaceae bacterium]